MGDEEDFYCGPFYFPKGLRKFLSHRFNLSCKWHDHLYRLKPSTRKHADMLFLKSMLSASQNRKEKAVAYIYYGFVRMFGWISWGRNDSN